MIPTHVEPQKIPVHITADDVSGLTVAGQLACFSMQELNSLTEGKKECLAVPIGNEASDDEDLLLLLLNSPQQEGQWWQVSVGQTTGGLQTYWLLLIDRTLTTIRELCDDHMVYAQGFTEPSMYKVCCECYTGFAPLPDYPQEHVPICCKKPYEEPDFKSPFFAQWQDQYGKQRHEWGDGQPVLQIWFQAYLQQADGSLRYVPTPAGWYPLEEDDRGDSEY